jgi:lipopolysaccharide transport system ATP-binding protein
MGRAIGVDSLSKQYRLGESRHGAMLRQAFADGVNRLIRRGRSKGEERPDTIWALKAVSFEVEAGEVVGIIGRNGAGKTTLLKLLSRITYPTSGTIAVRGRVASLVEVGTGFHQELTGRENVYLNGSILGLRKKQIDERFESIVEFAGVAPFIDTPIKRYSSGMRLRLGFAVAAHLSPDILLVDEILSVGDVDFQQKCLRALDDARGATRTVLFVSHNLEAVEQLCRRTIWIDHGTVRRDGPSREVIAAYLASVTDSASIALRFDEETHRTGSGEIRFTGLEFLTPEKQPKETIRSGDPLLVRLHFRVHRPVQNPHFGIRIYSDLGALVCDLNTWSSGLDVSALAPGDAYLDARIDFLNVMPGRFFVSLWTQRLGDKVVHDLIEHCAVLEVQPSNVLGSGRGLDRRFGLVFFPCSWEVSA